MPLIPLFITSPPVTVAVIIRIIFIDHAFPHRSFSGPIQINKEINRKCSKFQLAGGRPLQFIIYTT